MTQQLMMVYHQIHPQTVPTLLLQKRGIALEMVYSITYLQKKSRFFMDVFITDILVILMPLHHTTKFYQNNRLTPFPMSHNLASRIGEALDSAMALTDVGIVGSMPAQQMVDPE
jgi:hypothetical protein